MEEWFNRPLYSIHTPKIILLRDQIVRQDVPPYNDISDLFLTKVLREK